MKKNTENLMGISGSVPVSLHAAMEDKRWEYKKNMSQFVRMAVESFAISEGWWTPDTIDKSELTPDQLAAVEADEARAAEAAKAEADAAAKAAEGAQDDSGTDAEADKSEADKSEADKSEDDAADEQPTKPASRSRK